MANGTKKIRVLHILLSLEIGGMEQVVADLVKTLDTDRFEPIVICLHELGPIARELISNGFKVMQLERMSPVVSYLYPRALIVAIREVRASVVHVHSGCWHKAAVAARFCGITNVIYTDHGRMYPDSKVVMALDRLASHLTSHVVAVSSDLARYMREQVGISSKKVSLILNGVDVERFGEGRRCFRADGPVKVAIIARLAPVKDIATLIKAMVIVAEKNPKVSLEVIGDGPERNHLVSLTRDLGLDSVVSFLGFRRDIPKVLKETDIFVLSSLSEGTSITLLEAMAAGKPVVVTNVGGNPAIVKDAVNGYLVPPREPELLAQALLQLAGDPALCNSIAEVNMRKVGDNYSIQSMARRYEALYQGVAT